MPDMNYFLILRHNCTFTSFCYIAFFQDPQETWNTTYPDFSPCFQKTVILWTPCALLVLGTPIRIFQLSKSQVSPLPFTWLNIAKTVSILIYLRKHKFVKGNEIGIDMVILNGPLKTKTDIPIFV